MKIAYMFSGQGSQKIGMGKELYNEYSEVKKIYDICDKILPFKISEICFEENDLINDTKYTQPALLCTSIATLELLNKHNVTPDYILGLSLGEYTALVAGGVLSLEDAINLVHKRGTFMNEAVANCGETGMFAIRSSEIDTIKKVIDSTANIGVVEISNYNTIGQTVIAGDINALLETTKILLEQHDIKSVRLNVSGPFHTSFLKPASDKLNVELLKIKFEESKYPIITNLTGLPIGDASEISNILTKQVMSPVMWQQSIEYLISVGVDTFIEIGAGKTLCSFVKKINKNVNAYNIEDIESLNKTLTALDKCEVKNV